MPFWETYSVEAAPKLRSVVDLNDLDNSLGYMKNGLRLILWALILKFTALVLNDIVFNSGFILDSSFTLNIKNYKYMNLAIYNSMNIPFFEKWLAILMNTLFFLMYEVAGDSGVVIGLARLCGIQLLETHISLTKQLILKIFSEGSTFITMRL